MVSQDKENLQDECERQRKELDSIKEDSRNLKSEIMLARKEKEGL